MNYDEDIEWQVLDDLGEELSFPEQKKPLNKDMVQDAMKMVSEICNIPLVDIQALDVDGVPLPEEVEEETEDSNRLPLQLFLDDFGNGLFKAVSDQNNPLSFGVLPEKYKTVLSGLTRQLFTPQESAVAAVTELLINKDQPAAIINGEMGSGKTMMAIATAAITDSVGFKRTLVLCPPHLVYKWRREILQTIPNARVWILNGADTLAKLIKIRSMFQSGSSEENVPEFYILGRIRMRMGFHWKRSYICQKKYRYTEVYDEAGHKNRVIQSYDRFICPGCGEEIRDQEGKAFQSKGQLEGFLNEERRFCKNTFSKNAQSSDKPVLCGTPLWTLCRKNDDESPYDRTKKALLRLPKVGEKTAQKLIDTFGHDHVAEVLENNALAFANLMDENQNFVFTDAQARSLERSLGKMEFSLGQGGYQATEYIKRYLPRNYFGLMLVDEAHEYKNYGTAQGQAMGVLCRCVNKILALTGTLMGGYAEDIFYLIWRMNPNMMIEDGFRYNKSRSLGAASGAFMRSFGILKETIKTPTVTEKGSFTSSKAKRSSISISKMPGFSPEAIMRYILPLTVFVKLVDFGEGILPDYQEHFREIELSEDQRVAYQEMENSLMSTLETALKKWDTTLTSTVINALLSWPDICFRDMSVWWKNKGEEIYFQPSVIESDQITPKEQDVLSVCQEELSQGRRVLVYTTYTGKVDTATRMAQILKRQGIKACVLKSTVPTDEREDWVAEKLDQGMQVLICNPELVKTGLDLIELPTIYFMNTGYNVYTLMQAARRSWRIGQTEPVKVLFGGYLGTAQQKCLSLMAKKIAVTQSTSGDMPDCGLDILNQSGDSVEVELARQLITAKNE